MKWHPQVVSDGAADGFVLWDPNTWVWQHFTSYIIIKSQLGLRFVCGGIARA